MLFFFFSISCFSREVRMYSTLRMCAVRIGTSTPHGLCREQNEPLLTEGEIVQLIGLR